MNPKPLNKNNEEEEWQKKLLPLMSRMIIVLSAFFFIASLAQVIYLEYAISGTPKFDSSEALSYLPVKTDKIDNSIEKTRLKALVMLEGNMADNLYHQAHVLLMARIWTSYIGFVTGMILALVGATFVLGKLRAPQSQLGAKGNLWEVSFKSASPGLVLAVLGTTLMLATIFTHNDIKTNQQAVYLHDKTQYPLDTAGRHPDSVEIPIMAPPIKTPENHYSLDTTVNHSDAVEIPPMAPPNKNITNH
jgi:hypothetical protein